MSRTYQKLPFFSALYGAEGGTGSRRRQPSASAANENKIAILLIIKGIAIAFVIENYYLVVAN